MALVEAVPGTTPGTLRIITQMARAAMSAENTLTFNTSCQTSSIRTPAVTIGPNTSPTLPPYRGETARSRAGRGTLRDRAPMAGGWYSAGPIPASSMTPNITQ